MLADSGFTNVINVNGGITAIRQVQNDPCINDLLQTNVKYSVISPAEFCNRLAANKSSFILDVRSDSAFRHISTDAGMNWVGYYKNTVNIPLADLAKRMNEVPKNKAIMVTDIFGSDAANAAAMLVNAGYQNVSVLQEGIRRTFLTDSRVQACRQANYISPVQYNVLSTPDFGRMIVTKPNTKLLDIRSDDEYNNKSKDGYKNIGRLMNAIHIPGDELAANLTNPALVKTDPIILYSFTGDQKVFEAADLLSGQGFTNLYVLGGGLFDVRWSAANTMGLSYLRRYVVNVPEENL
jgi:rhodanese-related sulfurtransferase